MKLICNRDYKGYNVIGDELTYGKVYDISPRENSGLVIDEINWWIINDKGQEQYYFKFMFVTLEEWREIQLNKLV